MENSDNDKPHPPESVFDSVKQDIARILDSPGTPGTSKPFHLAFLNKESLRAYFLWFVNSPLLVNAINDGHEKAYIPHDSEKFTVTTGFFQAGSDGIKFENFHSLKRTEYKSAYQYLYKQNKSMLIAAFVLERGFLDYLDSLSTILKTLHPAINSFQNRFHAEKCAFKS